MINLVASTSAHFDWAQACEDPIKQPITEPRYLLCLGVSFGSFGPFLVFNSGSPRSYVFLPPLASLTNFPPRVLIISAVNGYLEKKWETIYRGSWLVGPPQAYKVRDRWCKWCSISSITELVDGLLDHCELGCHRKSTNLASYVTQPLLNLHQQKERQLLEKDKKQNQLRVQDRKEKKKKIHQNRLDVTVTTCHPIDRRKSVNSFKLLSLFGFFCPPKKKLPRHPHQVYKQQLQARHHRPASNSGAGAGLPFPSRSRSFISCLTCLTWLP
ncbi:N-acetylglucosamine-induced protein 1 [Fusarium oxysporum f. sp. albedinis]|nr:N-acetylglucosamine-induced protein 1 [Fusarium oxysporum f. sp. albedinis]